MNRFVQEIIVRTNHIVLMTPKRVTTEVVDRVIVKAARLAQIKLGKSSHQNAVAGAVIGNQIPKAAAFRSRILLMAANGIHIKSRSIYQKPATVSRLERLVARVPVDRAELHLVENVVLHPLHDLFVAAHAGFGGQAPELGLDPKNAVSDCGHAPILRCARR